MLNLKLEKTIYNKIPFIVNQMLARSKIQIIQLTSTHIMQVN